MKAPIAPDPSVAPIVEPLARLRDRHQPPTDRATRRLMANNDNRPAEAGPSASPTRMTTMISRNSTRIMLKMTLTGTATTRTAPGARDQSALADVEPTAIHDQAEHGSAMTMTTLLRTPRSRTRTRRWGISRSHIRMRPLRPETSAGRPRSLTVTRTMHSQETFLFSFGIRIA